jgi:HSP20 family molecular chaperone IbpA
VNDPVVDIFDGEGVWIVQIALAGVAETDIDVTLSGTRLIVRAARPESPLQALHREIARGVLRRELELPAEFELAGALFEDGLLTLHLRRSGGP